MGWEYEQALPILQVNTSQNSYISTGKPVSGDGAFGMEDDGTKKDIR
jgi:hypothetical protein